MTERAGVETVRQLAKIELHVHFEGCIGPDLLARMRAGRCMGRAELDALYSFEDFPGFLKAYSRVVATLERPEDFREAAKFIAGRLVAGGVKYVEFTFTPLPHVRRGLEHGRVIEATLMGLEDAGAAGAKLEAAFIYDTVRQWGAGAAEQSARIAVDDMNSGLPVVGFGVGGDELGCPAAELRAAFEMAADAGLGRYVHAGEVGGPRSVRDAVEILGADRIGHGIAAAVDPELLAQLAESGVCLDVCPTSNQFTRAVEHYEDNPWPAIAEAGVPVTIGSDDPGFFGAWLDEELERCASAWRLNEEALRALMATAARYSFQPEEKRIELEKIVAGS
jgi:aminodeoxyfutalosine deaminase